MHIKQGKVDFSIFDTKFSHLEHQITAYKEYNVYSNNSIDQIQQLAAKTTWPPYKNKNISLFNI